MTKRKLTDLQKKKILEDYIECQNYSLVGRKHDVSAETVRRVVASDESLRKKVEQKKEENTRDILLHLSQKSNTVCTLFDKLLEEMGNPEKIKKANIVQLATVFGVLADKYLLIKENGGAINENPKILEIKFIDSEGNANVGDTE